jgi:hypothetical protein
MFIESSILCRESSVKKGERTGQPFFQMGFAFWEQEKGKSLIANQLGEK